MTLRDHMKNVHNDSFGNLREIGQRIWTGQHFELLWGNLSAGQPVCGGDVQDKVDKGQGIRGG